MKWLALDIGGANIKAADGNGYAVSEPFPLWQKPRLLPEILRTVIAGAPPCDHLAATMTGELADCFANKAEGVQLILQALSNAADGRHTRVYLTNGMLVSPQVALRQPLLAAASNWHALARFSQRFAPTGNALLMDIGSTTTDLVPLANGQPLPSGDTDTERLLSGELVYTGVERSPVCALVQSIPYRERMCPIAQEVFATAADAYLTLEDLLEEPENTNTADGRPATREFARRRLARMICADLGEFTDSDAVAAAEAIAASQLSRITVALSQVVGRMEGPLETVIFSGRGEFLARRAIDRMRLQPKAISLSKELGPTVSRCAPAHALAVLAREGG